MLANVTNSEENGQSNNDANTNTSTNQSLENANTTEDNFNAENNNTENKIPTESKISSFSTPIVDDNKNRINNIKITCSRINSTVIKSNKEFSFCNIVGEPTAKDGYKEAHAFVNGKLVNAIGGGNCQVSTTIYNAVKKIDGIKITERHEHGKPVSYIEEGKDATVAYDYLDLKFENNNDYDIKLRAYIKQNKVYIDVYKLSY